MRNVYWTISVGDKEDFIFLDIDKLVNGFASDDGYVKKVKKQLGVYIEEKHDFTLRTNKEPDIYKGVDGETIVSFGDIEMSLEADVGSVKEWLEKYTEYEIKMKF